MDKTNTIIIDIGSNFTKCGTLSTYHPYLILTPNLISSFLNGRDRHIEIAVLFDFFKNIFYNYLLIDPNNNALSAKVFILENTLTSFNEFKSATVYCMKKMGIDSMAFIPSHIAATYNIFPISEIANQHHDILATAFCIVDCGFSQISILPIFSDTTILTKGKEWNFSGTDINFNLECCGFNSILDIFASFLAYYLDKNAFDNDTIQLIRYENLVQLVPRIFHVANRKNALAYSNSIASLLEGDFNKVIVNCPKEYFVDDILMDEYVAFKNFRLPGWIRELFCELIFLPNVDNETVPSLILETITECPIDCRTQLAQNIFFIGGLCMIPGFEVRMKEELLWLTKNSLAYSLKPYLNPLKYHTLPKVTCESGKYKSISPLIAAWTGAHIMIKALQCQPTNWNHRFNITSASLSSSDKGQLLTETQIILRQKMAAFLSDTNKRSLLAKYLPKDSPYLVSTSQSSHMTNPLQPFLIQFPPKRHLIDLILKGGSTKQTPSTNLLTDKTDIQESKADSKFPIPDWNVLDPKIRPYGHIFAEKQKELMSRLSNYNF